MEPSQKFLEIPVFVPTHEIFLIKLISNDEAKFTRRLFGV